MSNLSYEEVAWPNTPKNWDIVRLGSILVKKKEKFEDTNFEKLPVKSINNKKGFVDSEEQFDKQVYSEEVGNYGVVKPGEFAYNPARINVGSIAYQNLNDPVLISPMYEVFSVDEERLNPEYFRQFISTETAISLFESFSQGSVRKNLKFKLMEDIPFALPPLYEQRRIVEILSTVDEVIQQTEEIIETSKEVKEGLMQDLLIEGIGHNEFKEVKIGPKSYQIPETWRAVRLEEIADVSSGGTPKRNNDDYWEDGTIPWMKSGEMTNGKIREIEETITEEGLENSSAKIFEQGTVVMALYGQGTVSRTGILGQDAAINQAIAGMEPLEDAFEPRYLQMVLNFMRNIILNWAINPSSDTGRTNIYLGALRKLRVPLPPLDEQKEISEKLSTVNEKIRQEEEYREKLEELKKGLMQDLLTGKKRVEA